LIKCNTYKIFSILLSYPTIKLKNNINTINKLLEEDDLISTDNIKKINCLINFIAEKDLIYLQEYYVSIFVSK
jgi:nitrate reductase assembly molybdenum cofactor insertion protein NarJ